MCFMPCVLKPTCYCQLTQAPALCGSTYGCQPSMVNYFSQHTHKMDTRALSDRLSSWRTLAKLLPVLFPSSSTLQGRLCVISCLCYSHWMQQTSFPCITSCWYLHLLPSTECCLHSIKLLYFICVRPNLAKSAPLAKWCPLPLHHHATP